MTVAPAEASSERGDTTLPLRLSALATQARLAESVEGLLDERREQELFGSKEDDWLDFKSQPYVLKTPKQKWELAKDVAALANLPGGGCVVIGIRTVKDASDFEDKADVVVPFPCTLLDLT